MKLNIFLAVAISTSGMLPAYAQDAKPPEEAADRKEESVFDGDWLAVGLGAGYLPSYDGSDDYVVYPLPVVSGSLGGIGISPRAGGAAFDLFAGSDARVTFAFGPVARLRSNRVSQIEDPVVGAAGELANAFEVGPAAGVTVNRILHDYDWVTLGADLRWDVAGAHGGMAVEPAISYVTPLSRGLLVALTAQAEWVDGDFSEYYYSVSSAQSAASGLPLFAADSGWHKAGANAAVGIDLDGNFENGGFVIGLGGGYTRMLGDAKRTPYTSLRGDADQWFAAAGIGYIF